MFNAYEETIRVPLVISNPRAVPARRASHDRRVARRPCPDAAGAGGAPLPTEHPRRRSLGGVLARNAAPDRGGRARRLTDFGPVCSTSAPRRTRVRDHVAVHLRRPPGGHRAARNHPAAQPDPLPSAASAGSTRPTSTRRVAPRPGVRAATTSKPTPSEAHARRQADGRGRTAGCGAGAATAPRATRGRPRGNRNGRATAAVSGPVTASSRNPPPGVV